MLKPNEIKHFQPFRLLFFELKLKKSHRCPPRSEQNVQFFRRFFYGIWYAPRRLLIAYMVHYTTEAVLSKGLWVMNAILQLHSVLRIAITWSV
jgi:hypothetical protein